MKKIAMLGLMTALASAFFAVECLIPTPMPWMRLGLANSLTLLALLWWGWREGLVVLLLRIFLGGLISGRFMQPVFVLSLAGGLAAWALMAPLVSQAGRRVSIVGISVLGATGKNLAQLAVTAGLYTHQAALWGLLPLFLLSALVAGLFIGILVTLIQRRLPQPPGMRRY